LPNDADKFGHNYDNQNFIFYILTDCVCSKIKGYLVLLKAVELGKEIMFALSLFLTLSFVDRINALV
jgi:hypothetical protein